MSIEILIVDDNADIRNILNELIIDAGYKTRIAANYNQALGEIDKKMPDVAILDVKLDKGDNDGIELLSHIKSKNKDVPVIIITGHANVEMAVNSLKHGAFELIEKPGSTVVTNLRHYEFLSQALISLIEVEKGLENNISGDLLSIDLRKAIDSIGEITGQITNDEMLGNIFSNFCIGK